MEYLKFYSNAKKPYNKLSNFYYIKEGINYKGLIFPSIEHAYQSTRLINNDDKIDFTIKGKYGNIDGFKILFNKDEYINKQIYWMKKNNIGILAKMAIKQYDKSKLNNNNMSKDEWVKILMLKFKIPEFKDLLLSTNDKILYEFSRHPDFYTAYLNDKNELIGNNFMGECLMEVRNLLKK